MIIGSLSRDDIDRKILDAAGRDIESFFKSEYDKYPKSIFISTPPGQLFCQRIFFVKWDLSGDAIALQQAVADFIWNVIQHMIAHSFNSVAIPVDGSDDCMDTTQIVIQTMLKAIRKHLMIRQLSILVKFIVEPRQPFVFNIFREQILTSMIGKLISILNE